jgi:hypothetical protein
MYDDEWQALENKNLSDVIIIMYSLYSASYFTSILHPKQNYSDVDIIGKVVKRYV